ncbi:hypothetical protein MRB53_020537 [Persea americana]|uniref:Uncharacterized protein n=1 Tax=Persea americana TaxID=3435 RepID=A0ACC2L1U1_PERAE|nr:hypothetical protein MRB53_020537 [Persea americana]
MIVVVQIYESARSQSFQQSALDALFDIGIRYLRDLGKMTRFYGNFAGSPSRALTTTKEPKRRRTRLRDMANEARSAVQPWIEVVPALLISLQKSSTIPTLETIAEEDTDDCNDD